MTDNQPKCKRCRGLTVLKVDDGFHYIYINCPDCHPSFAEIRAKKALLDEGS